MTHYKLIRKRDGLVKTAPKVGYLTFFEDGTFRKKHDTPKVGRSLLLSPFSRFFTWQTTPITEILEKKKNYLRFLTKNSEYELFKVEKDE